MFQKIFFVLFYIWIGAAFASILVGPFVGLNRQKIHSETREFLMEKHSSLLIIGLRLGVFCIVHIGFLLPVSRPFCEVIGAMIFFVIYYFISR